MKRNAGNIKSKIAILLSAILLAAPLTACSGAGEDEDAGQDQPLPSAVAGKTLGAGYAADKVFSLNFDSSQSLNPISTVSTANMMVSSLVYETLFSVDESFQVSSRLVKSWESTDGGTTWMFHMDNSVRFHNGSTLTAADASYSISRAQRTEFYSKRLSLIYGVSAIDDGLLMISLQYPDMQFPARLTIPVIQYDSMNDEVPPGTGPYRYSDDRSKLVAFEEHPDAGNLPLDEIYLKEFGNAGDIIPAYEDSVIDLVTNDPNGLHNLGYGGSNEVRYYLTNSMHYLGFNTFSYFLCYPAYRYALNYAVNRNAIVKDAMSGAAVASPLPISPQSPLYNESYAATFDFDLFRCIRELDAVDVADHDSDGKLEYMVTGIPMEIGIDFIVCGDSAVKVAAARIIAEDLQSIGLPVNLRELGWKDYLAALEEGEFDMYYGEVIIPADFDLTSLLLSDGSLNYGGFEDVGYETAVSGYLAADDAARQTSCDLMCQQIARYATIIPICFEKQEVVTHRGVVSGMSPNLYNIFHNFTDWKITLE